MDGTFVGLCCCHLCPAMNSSIIMHAPRAFFSLLKTRTLAVLGLGLAVGLAGCAGPCKKNAVMATRYTLADTAKVMLLDETVAQAVECTGLQVVHRKDGRLEIIASLKNLSNATFAIQVGATFKGPAGETLADEACWHRLTLEGNNTVVARFVSQDGRAADFAVKVRATK